MPDEQTIIEHIRGRYERDRRIPHPGEIAVAERAGAVTLRGDGREPRSASRGSSRRFVGQRWARAP